MDKLTQLWIRACKSEDSTKRCNSILRRFYIVIVDPDALHTAIIRHLSPIVDQFCKYDTLNMISDLENITHTFRKDTPNDTTYRENAMYMLMSKIACTKKSEFEGVKFKKCKIFTSN